MLNIVQMNSKCIKLDKRKQKSIIMVLLTECFKIYFIKYWIGLRNLKLLLWSTLTLWHQISMSHNLNFKKKWIVANSLALKVVPSFDSSYFLQFSIYLKSNRAEKLEIESVSTALSSQFSVLRVWVHWGIGLWEKIL